MTESNRVPRRFWKRPAVLVAAAVVLLVLVVDAWLVRLYFGHPEGADNVAAAAEPVAQDSPTPSGTMSNAAGPSAAGPTPTPDRAGSTRSGAVTTPPHGRLVVAPAWVQKISARTNIPPRALTAYANAQLDMDSGQAACHMSWALLAGIGSIESGHGSYGGSVLQADGTTSKVILGPALDGSNGNAAIPATPLGLRLDGDARWDHAIGPMQFIPSTWSHWATSYDGGTPNPNDIDDAALTAARYLCAAGGDVSTADGWHKAIGAYNAPITYLVLVTNQANEYARLSLAAA
jgi:membrane-bound lytic murein transglycosylase B